MPAIAQPHCHQQAVLGVEADRRIYERAGIAVSQELTGCCGLAGNFGAEAGHEAISRKVAGLSLLPALEADPGAPVLADGFSCRTQIESLSGRRARHLAEVLAERLPPEGDPRRMSLERALAPLAIAVAVIALVVWLMLINDVALGPWLLAVLVFAHGWVHLMFVFPKPERPDGFSGGEYPFDFDRSWLIRRRGFDRALVQRIGVVVMAVTFVLSLLAALSTVALIVPTDWMGVPS